MKVAIIHYWLITRRGGEKVLESILKLYPQADIYTLFYDKERYGPYLDGHTVFTSVLDIPFFRKRWQKLFPLYPIGIHSLKLQDDYDLVISSESGPAKGVKINNNALHICYVHSPMRYCWGFTKQYLDAIPIVFRPVASYFFRRLKKWDLTTVANVDYYITNSMNVAGRVREYYKRDSVVIYPPIATSLFDRGLQKNNKEYYLSFGAITPYKRIDLLVELFNKSSKKLIVIGEGSEFNKLKKQANSNISFVGFLEEQLEETIQNARALIFPGEEDFGMIPLEVMSFGIPVVAYKKGGALETVIENRNNPEQSSGIFFESQTVEALEKALLDFEQIENQFDPKWIRNHAKNFEESRFLLSFKQFIDKRIDRNNEA